MSSATEGPALVNRVEELAPPRLPVEEPVRVREPVVVVMPAPAPEKVRKPWSTTARVLLALVVLGTGLRTVALIGGRCLWIDESMLALNLIQRTPAQLLDKLDWNQGAPVGFLMMSKLSVSVFGASEIALRLVPFLGSVLGLVLFAWSSRKFLPNPAAILATGLFSVSPYLISYSAECKQYATDAALTVALFAVAAPLLRGGPKFGAWFALAFAGAAAVWFSHPAAFVLGGIGIALLSEGLFKRNQLRFIAASLVTWCWLASFGACYLVSLRHLGSNQYLLDYWNGHFLPLPPKSLGDLTWMLDHFFTFFAFPGGLGGTEIRAGGIAAALFAIGVAGFWKERWPMAIALVAPAVLAALASGLHKYPLAGRLMLFLVPLAVLGVSRGAWMTASALRRRLPVAAGVLLAILVAAPMLEAYQELRRPARTEQLEPVLATVKQNWQPGDRMYVYYGAIPAFQYYTRSGGFPEDAVTLGTEARTNRTEYREQLASLKGQRRVWLVFSHRHQNEELVIRVYAEGLGQCVRSVDGSGASAYLFDFSVSPGRVDQPGTGVAAHGEQIGAKRAEQ